MPDIVSKKDFINIITQNLKQTQIQIISEGYEILKKAYKLQPQEIAKIFEKINSNKLKSELLSKASYILLTQNTESKKYIIDETKDVITDNNYEIDLIIKSLEKNTLNTLMIQAFVAKNFSQQKEKRALLHDKYFFTPPYNNINLKHFITLLESSFNFAFFISYVQYIDYVRNLSKLNILDLVKHWDEESDMKSFILSKLTKALQEKEIDELLANFLVKEELVASLQDFKSFITLSISFNIPTPCFTASLNYFCELINDNSGANLVELFKIN